MFKVECPGCKAPYQVDERRVPATGLKMRCPKCGTSFKVDAPADSTAPGPGPVLGAALGLKSSQAPQAPRTSVAPDLKSTMLGVAAPGGTHANKPPLPKREPAGGAAAPRPGAVPAPPVRPPMTGIELDLPDVPDEKAGPVFGELDLDLPARRSPQAPAAPRAGASAPLDLDVDLPDVSAPAPRGLQLSEPPAKAGDVDLPAPGRASADLPAPAQRAPGLPAPVRRPAALPATRGGPDLPSPRAQPSSGAGLPSPVASLPSPGGELPQPAQSLPEVAGVLPSRRSEAPLSLPPLDDAGDSDSFDVGDPFGELDLPGGDSAAAMSPPSAAPPPATQDPFGELPLDPTEEARHSSRPPGSEQVVRKGGGGTSFGEVSLEGEGDSVDDAGSGVALDEDEPPTGGGEEDMEFGAIPQEEAEAGATQKKHVPAVRKLAPEVKRKSSNAVKVVAGVLVVVSVGGGSLALVPDIGPFGYYFVTDTLRAGEYEKIVSDTVSQSRQLLAKDTFPNADLALKHIESTRSDLPRVKSLAAYAAFVGFIQELRFGADPEKHARATVLLKELEAEPGVTYAPLARATMVALDGKLAEARRLLSGLAVHSPGDIDVLVAIGEVDLRRENGKTAIASWNKASGAEQSARTSFGLARAYFLAKKWELAEKHAQAAQATEKSHVGSRLLLARIALSREGGESVADKLLKGVISDADSASRQEIVNAYTLHGDVELSRSRISNAEKSYGAALELDAKAPGALYGLGAALLAAGRYSEALARFEAASQSEPESLDARLGIVECLVALERLKDAQGRVGELVKQHKKSMRVAYWNGRVLEALGEREAAETAYKQAVANADKQDSAAVQAYVALARLVGQRGEAKEAQSLLDEAQATLPESPAIHRALGLLALSQARYDVARAEFDRAILLDPNDLASLFQRAVTLRRANKLEQAALEFDAVAKVDPEYPGLALERGMIHEASGKIEAALNAYESALRKAPNDLDLMLRVGCSSVSAGRAAQAEKLLRKVLAKRPVSAETNHCLGRALLHDNKRVAESLRLMERAVELDPNRPEYYLYVGWAANEAGNLPKASSALAKALELDQSLADAYWQRGVLLARQGAVKDAIVDLNKALSLRPTRYEAHATLADAYYDLGQEGRALAEWHKALSAGKGEPSWHFRYGKLLLANRRTDAAREALTRALNDGEKQDPQPRWLVEAHRALALALGKRADAVPHWQAFLKTAPKNSPYREEAERALKDLGKPWQGR